MDVADLEEVAVVVLTVVEVGVDAVALIEVGAAEVDEVSRFICPVETSSIYFPR